MLHTHTNTRTHAWHTCTHALCFSIHFSIVPLWMATTITKGSPVESTCSSHSLGFLFSEINLHRFFRMDSIFHTNADITLSSFQYVRTHTHANTFPIQQSSRKNIFSNIWKKKSQSTYAWLYNLYFVSLHFTLSSWGRFIWPKQKFSKTKFTNNANTITTKQNPYVEKQSWSQQTTTRTWKWAAQSKMISDLSYAFQNVSLSSIPFEIFGLKKKNYVVDLQIF